MDTSELLAEVQRRIADTSRDRDRLAEAVVALEEEIEKLSSDAAVIARLTSWFAPNQHRGARDDEAAARDSDQFGTSVMWPAGPGFDAPIKAKKLKGRARSKLASASWYLDTLRSLRSANRSLDHVLGVEMAVDGVVQSLCSAFETMLCALTKALEKVAEIPEERRTPAHLVSWSKLAAAATVFDIDLASSLSISDALVGEHSEEPHGWMAQLLILRRRLALHDYLVPAGEGARPTDGLRIDVPGRGALPVIDYLAEARDLTEELLETMEHDINDAKHGRLYIAAIDDVRARAEQGIGDLLSSSYLPSVENLKQS